MTTPKPPPPALKVGDPIVLQAYDPETRRHGVIIDTPTKTASMVQFDDDRKMLISNILLRKVVVPISTD